MGTSALGNVVRVAGSWLFLSSCLVVSVIYFDELRAAGRWLFGVPSPESLAVSQPVASLAAVERPASRPSSSTVELRSDRMGHFVTSAQINGRSIDVMVDTGASIVALTWEDAERAGIFVKPSDFTHRVSTANGIARVAPVVIDAISIGDITVRNVEGAVTERGKLSGTLLGMTFLGKLSRAEMRRGTLILEE